MSDLLKKIQADSKKDFEDILPKPSKYVKPKIKSHGTITITKEGVKIHRFATDKPGDSDEWKEVIVDWGIGQLRRARKLIAGEPSGIHRYSDAIRTSVRNENWFAALYMALTMPDICGALETPSAKPGKRYISWFEKYVAHEYTPHLFSANDCYYLRCSALHSGLPKHEKVQAKRIAFLAPVPNVEIHCCFSEPEEGEFVLLLQVDIFCEHIVKGVEKWSEDIQENSEILERIGDMITFMDGTQPIDLS